MSRFPCERKGTMETVEHACDRRGQNFSDTPTPTPHRCPKLHPTASRCFPTPAALRRHFKPSHGAQDSDGPIRCTVRSRGMEEMESHRGSHMPSGCPHCQFVSQSATDIRTHMLKHQHVGDGGPGSRTGSPAGKRPDGAAPSAGAHGSDVSSFPEPDCERTFLRDPRMFIAPTPVPNVGAASRCAPTSGSTFGYTFLIPASSVRPASVSSPARASYAYTASGRQGRRSTAATCVTILPWKETLSTATWLACILRRV
ncbi:uncharacterized protein FYW61_009064 [Anableps anableps]